MKYLATWLVAVTFTWPAWAGGDSSDGHTHAVQVPVVSAPISTALPRLSAETDQFELVGVLEGKVLKLYLDQFGTNTPVAKAQLEVESGAWKAMATEVEPAVYTVAAELLAQPGKHPLTITVQAGDEADLMNATLETGPSSTVHAATQSTRSWGTWAAGTAAVVLTLTALVLARKHRQKRGLQSARSPNESIE